MIKSLHTVVKKNGYFAALIALILFHTFFNLYWHRINLAPPTWDSAGHLTIAYIMADKLSYLFRGDTSIYQIIRVSGYYPPFVHFLGSIVILILGRNFLYPLFVVETAFFVLAIYFLYKLVFHYTHSPKVAFYSSLIFSLFPHVWQQSRDFHLDIPLTSLILIANYLLLKADSLKNKKYSILFFIVLGLVQMTKWYGFVYLLIPLAHEFFIPLTKHVKDLTDKRLSNLLIGLVLSLVIVLPWYVSNLNTLLANVKVAATADAGDPANVLSYESIFHYLELITVHQIGIISLALVIMGMILLNKTNKGPYKFVAYSIFIPYVIFTFISNKDLRYVLPLTPYFAFLISFLFAELGNKIYSRVSFVIYLSYLSFVFLFLSINQMPPRSTFLYTVGPLISGPYGHVWVEEPQSYSYNPLDWRGQEILAKVQERADKLGLSANHFKVLELADNRFYSAASFDLYKLQNRYFNMDFEVPYFMFEALTADALSAYISKLDFAIVPDYPGPPGLRNIAVLNQLINYFKSESSKDFYLVKTYALPDKNVISIYERRALKNNIDFNVKQGSIAFKIGSILLLDKEKYGIDPFDITYTYQDGKSITKVVQDNNAQVRIPLDGVTKFVVKLPPDKIFVEQMQGWTYDKNLTFTRDAAYTKSLRDSNNVVYYQDISFNPASTLGFGGLRAKSTVTKLDNSIRVELVTKAENAFVAYATSGWNWSTTTLTSDHPVIDVPLEGLIQLEVTSNAQGIAGFGANWGVFACYEGRAVCYYPLASN